MRSISTSFKILQVALVVFLMGLVSWLATGWQEQPLLLGLEQQDSLQEKVWSEAHLITPVTIERNEWTKDPDMHAL